MNRKSIILVVISDLVVLGLLLLGYCHFAPDYVKNGVNINNVTELAMYIGLAVSFVGFLAITLYELISKKQAKPLFYLLASVASLNPISAGAGLMVYKQNGGKVSNAKLGLVVYIFALLSSVWFLNIIRVILNFLFTANAAKKESILELMYLWKYLLIIFALAMIGLPSKLLPKFKVLFTILEIACIPVVLTATPIAVFAASQLSIIKYELAAAAGKDKLPDDVLVRMEHVGIGFGRGLGVFQVVSDLNLDIYKGETLGLVGESGSGKTTIGRAIIGVNKTNAGKIIFHDKIINASLPAPIKAEVKKGIQMIFQDPAASLNERTTVDYIISEGLRSFHLYKNEADRAQKVDEAIRSVGLLPEHLSRYPHEFSGGQRQRIGIARAIIMRPELIIADEPISALDVSIRAQVLNLLKEFQKERGLTYLFIAHDLSVVRYVADRIAVIYKGQIVELAESEELFKNPLHPYTRSLLSAIPVPDPELERNKTIIKYVPDGLPGRELLEVAPKHFVRATPEELKEYKKQLK